LELKLAKIESFHKVLTTNTLKSYQKILMIQALIKNLECSETLHWILHLSKKCSKSICCRNQYNVK